MTDKTKTPRELALEAFDDGIDQIHEMAGKDIVSYMWKIEDRDSIREALSQAEKPEPIEGLDKAIIRAECIQILKAKVLLEGPVWDAIFNAAKQFHNLTKAQK